MIAAIYARKSTDQTGVSDDQKSVARQIDHAKAYAQRKGWQVDAAHVYVDDGISGAEFARRPGFLRLMNALRPRAPFQALVMSEESRLGREAIETAYALKQLIQAGVRVFFYLEDRERTLESPTDKLLMSVTAFADEVEREKARQRTYDAMQRKARAKHVTGGRVFGYRNVDVTADDGAGRQKRVSVTREINAHEAVVVRRIFELAAGGFGVKRIAKTLNADGAPSPIAQRGRPSGWATSSVRAVLYRQLYRGVLVWNQTRKRDAWGRKAVQDRPVSEWLQIDAPEWRIVAEELWQAAHARLERARATYLAGTGGARWGRPVTGTESKYLLTGIARCGICGGGMTVRPRKHGHHGERRFLYACSAYHYRGSSVCPNSLHLPILAADAAVLDMLAEDVLDPTLIDEVIEAVWRQRDQPDDADGRRGHLELELGRLDREVVNLTNALAAGGDLDSVVAGLRSREDRRRILRGQLDVLRTARSSVLSRDQVAREVHARLGDWNALAGRHVADTRKLLGLVLADKIVLTPQGKSYELRAPLTFERIFTGMLCPQGVASPVGTATLTAIEPAGRTARFAVVGRLAVRAA